MNEPKDALPYLEAGGWFELVLAPMAGSRKRKIMRMKLIASDGSHIDGAWGNAKKKLERQMKLRTVITGRIGQRWYLK